jgi:voltage-gated potassium channel
MRPFNRRGRITCRHGGCSRDQDRAPPPGRQEPGRQRRVLVSGDVTSADDLRRAGIEEAMAAVVCPVDASNEADMRSILAVMAIESIAPQVRTAVEANNPDHVEHFRRAHADEIVVSSRLVSRLMARSSLYPGLAEIVTDIVSGGEGSELYRISLPDGYVGLSVDQLSERLRSDHSATLLAVSRNGSAFINPEPDFRLQLGDDAVVVAQSRHVGAAADAAGDLSRSARAAGRDGWDDAAHSGRVSPMR